MSKSVILIHGALANSSVMKNVQIGMKNKGYNIYSFNYKTSDYSLNTLSDLDNLVKSIKEQEIYIVGHSMGGLIARNYITHYQYNLNNSFIKGIVTIASPHNQSLSAHIFEKSIFKSIFGTAGDSGLTKELQGWNSDIPIGCIAGLSNSILGANIFMVLTRRKAPNDGTIFLDEAILENCNDHIIIKGSHTGLLFKKELLNQCIHFIENRCFNRSTN